MATQDLTASSPEIAATNANRLGIDLYRNLGIPGKNLCLSPYSIATVLAMVFAGTDGQTRAEMSRSFGYPEDEAALHESFLDLRRTLEEIVRSNQPATDLVKGGKPDEPITLAIANRLFPGKAFELLPSFIELVKQKYNAPPLPLDYADNASGATDKINKWVADQTHERILDLIPPHALDAATTLVLVNALYFKGHWEENFELAGPKPFHLSKSEPVTVPTMRRTTQTGVKGYDGFTAVTIPYGDGKLQLLILLPREVEGLPALEAKLTPELLAECAKLDARHNVTLYLPKFKLEPPTLPVGAALQKMGMKSAFDGPDGTANFDRLAAQKPGKKLSISEVFHKAFISVDEKGTEAAAATAAVITRQPVATRPVPPVVVNIDRSFIFAVQHCASGACLFLGRVTDPR